MEQNANTTTPVIDKGNQKNKNGLKIATVIVSIVAVCGIGFGIWAALDANSQKSQIDSLKQQNTILQEQITELTAKLNEKTSENTADKTDNYIYIEELGIKIKKSDSLPNIVAYSTDQNHFKIKENTDAEDFPPKTVSFMRAPTCNKGELTIGYSTIININDTCYIAGQIQPYGSDPEYPLTEFLEYVLNANNYSSI